MMEVTSFYTEAELKLLYSGKINLGTGFIEGSLVCNRLRERLS